MIASIILAAGKGSRMKSKTVNKVTLPFNGKPILKYGIDLFEGFSSKIVIVVGAFAQSVQKLINGDKNIIFAYQKKRLGTAHAVKMGMNSLKGISPAYILVGMGDHMMFYRKETIKGLLELHKKSDATISLITTVLKDPTGYGRVERDEEGHVLDIVEEKDASEKQKQIKEINAGLYCFDYKFLKKNIVKIKKSPVSKEYYLTDIVRVATSQGKKVVGLKVPFEEVGIGVNLIEELKESQELYKSLHK